MRGSRDVSLLSLVMRPSAVISGVVALAAFALSSSARTAVRIS